MSDIGADQDVTIGERLNRVDQLDLEPVVFKLTHSEQDQVELSLARADQDVALYRCFLKLCVLHPGVALVPTRRLDHVWHTHMLDTAKYRADCEAVFGRFMDHFPYAGLRGEEDRRAWREDFATTCRLFMEHFGVEWATSQRRARAAIMATARTAAWGVSCPPSLRPGRARRAGPGGQVASRALARGRGAAVKGVPMGDLEPPLAGLLRLAQWGPRQLVSAINARLSAQGRERLRLDPTAGYSWVSKGFVPRPPVPDVAASVLSERLGYPVTAADLWPGRQATPGTLALSAVSGLDAVASVDDLIRELGALGTCAVTPLSPVAEASGADLTAVVLGQARAVLATGHETRRQAVRHPPRAASRRA